MESRTRVGHNLAMLSLDLTEEGLARFARHQARIIKEGIARLISDSEGPGVSPVPAAEHLYVIWSGAIIAWAIDGSGDLATG